MYLGAMYDGTKVSKKIFVLCIKCFFFSFHFPVQTISSRMADIHRKEAFLRGWKSSLHLVCEVKLSWQKHFKHRSFLLLTLQEAAASAGPQSLLLHHHQQQHQHQRRQPKTNGDRPRSATGFFEQQGKRRLSYFGEIDVDEINNGGGGRRRISQGREGGGGGGPGSWVEATEEERSVSGSRWGKLGKIFLNRFLSIVFFDTQ